MNQPQFYASTGATTVYNYAHTITPITSQTNHERKTGSLSFTLSASQTVQATMGGQTHSITSRPTRSLYESYTATQTSTGTNTFITTDTTGRYAAVYPMAVTSTQSTVGHQMWSQQTSVDWYSETSTTRETSTPTGRYVTRDATGTDSLTHSNTSTQSSTNTTQHTVDILDRSNSFTLHEVTNPTMEWVTNWNAGTFSQLATLTHSTTASTRSETSTMTQTWGGQVATHSPIGGTATVSTQDYVDRNEYHSYSVTTGEQIFGPIVASLGSMRSQATFTLSEIGSATEVTSTTRSSLTMTAAVTGSDAGLAGVDSYTSTVSEANLDEQTKITAANGDVTINGTTSHDKYSENVNEHITWLGGTPLNPSVRMHRNTDKINKVYQQVNNTVTSHSGTAYSKDENSKTWRGQFWSTRCLEMTTTFAMTGTASEMPTTMTSTLTDVYTVVGIDGASDSEWLAFFDEFTEAFVESALLAVVVIAVTVICPPVGLALGFALAVYMIPMSYHLGNALYGGITGVDPDTGATLSGQDRARVFGGFLGGLAGGFVGNALGVRVMPKLIGRLAAKVAHGKLTPEWLKGRSEQIANRLGQKPCFVAGTLVLLDETGTSKPIEQLRAYHDVGDECDWVLARDQFDPIGPLTRHRILEMHVRVARVWKLHVGGEVFGTTEEHPFWVQGRGWTKVGELRVGDWLLCRDGTVQRIDQIVDTGVANTVYNFHVEDAHTYFVGERQTWTHNAHNTPNEGENQGKPKQEGEGVNDEFVVTDNPDGDGYVVVRIGKENAEIIRKGPRGRFKTPFLQTNPPESTAFFGF